VKNDSIYLYFEISGNKLPFWKESLNSDGQKFNQYQQNK
jgi:hypothetical protein